MRPEDIVHREASSSWLFDTVTMLCGIKVDKDETTKTGDKVDCKGCLAEMAKAAKK